MGSRFHFVLNKNIKHIIFNDIFNVYNLKICILRGQGIVILVHHRSPDLSVLYRLTTRKMDM